MEKKEQTHVSQQALGQTSPQRVQLSRADVNSVPSFDFNTRTSRLEAEIMEDGVVTKQETLQANDNLSQIIQDFLMAKAVLAKMENNPNAYSSQELDAAKFTVNWLQIEREKAYALAHKTHYFNTMSHEELEKRERRRQERQKIVIELTPAIIFALNGNAKDLVQIAEENERRRVMTPAQMKLEEQKIYGWLQEVIEAEAKHRAQHRKFDKEQYMRYLVERDRQRTA